MWVHLDKKLTGCKLFLWIAFGVIMLRAKKNIQWFDKLQGKREATKVPECISLNVAFLCHFCPCILLILLHFPSLHLSLS